MKNLFKGILSVTKSLSEKLENHTLLVDKVWCLISIDPIENKTSYIFRSKNDQLLISKNGVIEKAKWEYIKTSNCLLLEINGISKLFQVLHIREHYLIFQNDFDTTFFVFVNESYYRNKYAKSGAKVLDFVLRDIGDKRFKIKSPANQNISQPLAQKETLIMLDKHPSLKEIHELPKESIKVINITNDKRSELIDGNMRKVDEMIKNLGKYSKNNK